MPRAKKSTTVAPETPQEPQEADPSTADAPTTAVDANGTVWTVEGAPGIKAKIELGPPAPAPVQKPPSKHAKRRAEMTAQVNALLQRFQAHRFEIPDTADDAVRELFAVYCATGKLDEDEAIADALGIQYRELNAAFQAACTQREVFEHLRAVPAPRATQRQPTSIETARARRHADPASASNVGNRRQRRALAHASAR